MMAGGAGASGEKKTAGGWATLGGPIVVGGEHYRRKEGEVKQ